MKIVQKVQNKWQRFREKRRKIIRSKAKGATDGLVRCRAQIVIALVQGKRVQEIAGILQCSTSHVYNTAGRFLEHGEAGLIDRREDNGQRKTNEQCEDVIWTLVLLSPKEYGHRRPTWTQELLIAVLAQKTGIRISRASMSRLLAREKIRLGRPKPYVKCPWPKNRKASRLRRLRYLLLHARPGEVWVFADEVDIHLNPKIGPDWMLPGIQKKASTPGVNEKRYLAGALNAFTGQLTWVEADSKDSLLFRDLLFQLGWDYPGVARIHVIVDRYSIHKSQFTKSVRSSCFAA
jgi:transposase